EFRGDRRLLRRAEPRVADRGQRALLLPARRVRLPEALEHHRGVAGGGAVARPARGAARRRRGPQRARARRTDEDRQVTPDKLVRPEVLAMSAYPVADAAGMVKLDAMENPYPLPPALQRQLAERLASVALNRYPEPNPRALRELISRKMRVPAGMELLLGNGSDDLIQILTLALARPGAALMYPSPTFVMYGMNATFSRMRAVPVPLRADFSFDADAFIARMREESPALGFLAYPKHPPGVRY